MEIFQKYYNFLIQYIDSNKIYKLFLNWVNYKRKYHGLNHLKDILNYIENKRYFILNHEEYAILILAAFFHDAIYDTKGLINNEEESKEFFKDSYIHTNEDIKNKVLELIECTKYRKEPKDRLSNFFWWADNYGFTQGFNKLKQNEKLIRVEFNHVPIEKYKDKRISFLKINLGLFNKKVDKDIRKLIDWIIKTY